MFLNPYQPLFLFDNTGFLSILLITVRESRNVFKHLRYTVAVVCILGVRGAARIAFYKEKCHRMQ